MKVSQMHFRTLREVPTEAEIPSHILLLRAGMIKKTAAGIYSYMPMGWRTIRKIEQIVREEIDAFSKLKFESQFQALSSGGAISYVEVPDMKDNIAAVLQVIRFIYDNIMYAELNTKSDYCQECGYDGEIQIITDEEGKLVWECPHCGNRNQDTLNVARRTCGYIGTQFWNQGRTQEIKERVLHL